MFVVGSEYWVIPAGVQPLTQRATASPLQPGRMLPMMMSILIMNSRAVSVTNTLSLS
jgi:hypothetical protein